MFTNIDNKELPILAKVISSDFITPTGSFHKGANPAQCLATLVAIDDMLSVRKVRTLMLRKRGFQQAIDGRITQLIEELKEIESD